MIRRPAALPCYCPALHTKRCRPYVVRPSHALNQVPQSILEPRADSCQVTSENHFALCSAVIRQINWAVDNLMTSSFPIKVYVISGKQCTLERDRLFELTTPYWFELSTWQWFVEGFSQQFHWMRLVSWFDRWLVSNETCWNLVWCWRLMWISFRIESKWLLSNCKIATPGGVVLIYIVMSVCLIKLWKAHTKLSSLSVVLFHWIRHALFWSILFLPPLTHWPPHHTDPWSQLYA